MPNYCNGYLRIKGRRENVDEFINILKQNYNYNNYNPDDYKHKHMYRIFEANPLEYPIDEYGLIKTVDVQIECAWSFYSCMFNGPHTYYYSASKITEPYKDSYGFDISEEEWINNIKKIKQRESHHTHIIDESARLNLIIEGISEEPGMAFQEHFAIDCGKVIFDDIHTFVEYWPEGNGKDNYEKFIKDYPDTIVTEEEFYDDLKYGYIIRPYDYIEETIYVDDADPYAFKREMCKIVKK